MRAFRKELEEPSEIEPPPSSAVPEKSAPAPLHKRRTRMWSAIALAILLIIVIAVAATR